MVPWFAQICCRKRRYDVDNRHTRPLFGVDETFRKSSSEKFRTKRSREL